MKHWKHSLRMAGLMAVLCVIGCQGNTTLYSNVSEEEANAMLSVLRREAGIIARKAAGSKGTWSVMVDPAHFTVAVDVLKENGLPEEKFRGVGELFEKSALISSPAQERIRYVDGLSKDLSETLSKIDGVIRARVHLVLPVKDTFTREVEPSSASVFIKYRNGAKVEDYRYEVESFILNSVQGLAADRISTVMVPAEDSAPASSATGDLLLTDTTTKSASSLGLLQNIIIVQGLAIITLAVILVLRWIRQNAPTSVPMEPEMQASNALPNQSQVPVPSGGEFSPNSFGMAANT